MIKKLVFITACLVASQCGFAQEIKIEKPAQKETYQPLDQIVVSLNTGKTVEVVDGKGNIYFSETVQPTIAFVVGGFPGYHHIRLRNKKNAIIDEQEFFVECETRIITDNEQFNQLFDRLKWNIYNPGEARIVRYNDQPWFLMSDWLRDHVNILKGKKYFSRKLKDAIDLFAENQLENGMVFDFYRPASSNYWVERFENRDFIDLREDEGHVFQRVPVENDVEFWFVMGIYHTWQATGDDTWMQERLVNAEKALQYNMTSPFVWSEKYRLIKRAFTIDTWDFTPKDDAALVGGDIMESIPGKSRYGIMHGDNTGFAEACKMLSTMYAYSGNSQKAGHWEEVSNQILDRLNELSWNGQFYTHYVDEEEGVTRDMGVDLKSQIYLSNSFALNRGIDPEKATQIINTYKNIRSEMPEKSPAEFYAIYPPFKKGFNINEWHYVNGGVFPFIGGELALGAYENGEESYASDILTRINDLMDIDDGDLPYYYIGNIPERPETNFTSLSVEKQANVDFSGTGAENVPGWTGEGTANDLSDIPTGKKVFEGVPYQIVDPQQNKRKGCIGLAKSDQYAQSSDLKINKQAKSIYFLHTMAGSGMAGWVDIHYADGATHKEYVESGKQLNNWWNPMNGKYSRVTGWDYKKAWSYNNGKSEVGLYQWGLDNPHPEKKIEMIEFQHALNSTKWFIIGVTLSDQPVYFTWPKSTGTHLVNWNAGSVMRAYIEGLAGVKDNGALFKNVTISPRWSSAGINQSSVTVTYPASNECIKYNYKADSREINLLFTGSFNASEIKVLMPADKNPEKILLDGNNVAFSTDKLGDSIYAIVDAVSNSGVHRLKIVLE